MSCWKAVLFGTLVRMGTAPATPVSLSLRHAHPSKQCTTTTAIRYYGQSQTTEVHILAANSNYTAFSLQVGGTHSHEPTA